LIFNYTTATFAGEKEESNISTISQADLFPKHFFGDFVASSLEPGQVFVLLETVYGHYMMI